MLSLPRKIKDMKRILFFVLFAASLLAVSCNKPEDGPNMAFAVATVTFRPQADGSYYLKLDEKTALIVTNPELQKYPFEDGKEKRAIIQLGFDPENPGTGRVDGFEDVIDVVLYDFQTLNVKSVVAYDKEQEQTYGDDPVGLYLEESTFPPTTIEDGYLCVHFAMEYSGEVTHTINAVYGTDPEDPYLIEFRHNYNGDVNRPYESDSYINFSLKDLPDTNGETVKLTLKWNSLATGKYETVQFDYKTRTDW